MSYTEKEITDATITHSPFGPGITFASPLSPRENLRLTYARQGLWIPSASDKAWFCPSLMADNIARAFVIEHADTASGRYEGPVGGKDIFGIDWEYVPSSHGSIVRPGHPTLTDISTWEDTIHFPDVDTWDWAGSLEKNRDYLQNSPVYQNFCIFTGWFERLISFMDFGPAAYALMSKKTRPYATALLERLTDLWIEVADKVHETYGSLIDGFTVHDDWGAQDGPFFNPRLVNETLVPAMKRFTDHVHALGYTCELHSCGRLAGLVTCIAEAGWDSWDGMAINDYEEAYDKVGSRLIMSVPFSALQPDAGTDDRAGEVPSVRDAATAFADKFARREAPVFLSMYGGASIEFKTELYRLTRQKFDSV